MKRTRIVISAAAFIVGCTILVVFFFSMEIYRWQTIISGNTVIRKIEAYKKQSGQYPASLEDVGFPVTLSGPFFYEKLSENHYQVWFGLKLGESCTFDSVAKQWR